MAIAIALVLIFVLYLIDKHSRWREAFKLTVGLFVIAILSVGGLFGWQKYEAWQEARQEARQEAEYEVEQAMQAVQKQVDLAKTCKDWEDKHPIGSPPDKVNDDKQFFVLGPPQGCEGPLETDYNTRNVYGLVPANASKLKPKLHTESQPQSQPNCQVVNCSDWVLVSSEHGSRIQSRDCFVADLSGLNRCGTIAVLKKGDRVQILSDKVRAADGSEIYEAKFQQWTGWVEAADLSPDIAKP